MNASLMLFAKKPKAQETGSNSPHRQHLTCFWARVQTKHPGKGKVMLLPVIQAWTNEISFVVSAILPKGMYTREAGNKPPRRTIKEENALVSYEVAMWYAKPRSRNNLRMPTTQLQIFRPRFWYRVRLQIPWKKLPRQSHSIDNDDPSKSKPKSVKRVGDIFDDPKFIVNAHTPNDIRQGRIRDCWFVAALGALGNKPGLIEKVCIARDEEIGVCGFFSFRDGEWRPEVIDDKLYLKHPGFDWRKSGVPGNPELNKQRQITEEENYRKMYQVLLESFTNKCNVNLSSALQRPSIS